MLFTGTTALNVTRSKKQENSDPQSPDFSVQ